MKRFRILAAGMAVCAMLAAGCTGRADNRPDGGANSLETVGSGAVVTEFSGSSLTPDATLPTVIDFNADWCGPCRMFKPVFHEAAARWAGKALFVSVNVDNNGAVARQFGVTAIPQVTVLFPDGRQVTTAGFMDKAAFAEFLDGAIGR